MLVRKGNFSESKIFLTLFVNAGVAEPGPPLGTVLGNLGVNSSKFCKDFNAYTSGLPKYFKLKVDIIIDETRNYEFFTRMPSTSYIISILKFEKSFKVFFGNFASRQKRSCIFLSDVVKLALFKFPHISLRQSFLMC